MLFGSWFCLPGSIAGSISSDGMLGAGMLGITFGGG